MPFVRKRMTPFAQYKLKLERPAWKLETARTAGRCERDGDACDPGAFSCFAAAFSRLRRRVRNRAGLSARPMVTSQTLRVSLMPDLLALCADWLRLVAGVFFVFCGADFACRFGEAQARFLLCFSARSIRGGNARFKPPRRVFTRCEATEAANRQQWRDRSAEIPTCINGLFVVNSK